LARYPEAHHQLRAALFFEPRRSGSFRQLARK
jgi:hypothetical protein